MDDPVFVLHKQDGPAVLNAARGVAVVLGLEQIGGGGGGPEQQIAFLAGLVRVGAIHQQHVVRCRAADPGLVERVVVRGQRQPGLHRQWAAIAAAHKGQRVQVAVRLIFVADERAVVDGHEQLV